MNRELIKQVQEIIPRLDAFVTYDYERLCAMSAELFRQMLEELEIKAPPPPSFKNATEFVTELAEAAAMHKVEFTHSKFSEQELNEFNIGLEWNESPVERHVCVVGDAEMTITICAYPDEDVGGDSDDENWYETVVRIPSQDRAFSVRALAYEIVDDVHKYLVNRPKAE